MNSIEKYYLPNGRVWIFLDNIFSEASQAQMNELIWKILTWMVEFERLLNLVTSEFDKQYIPPRLPIQS